MARTPFKLEVLTPEGEVFNDEVVEVVTRTSVGDIGILAHHVPVLAMLDPAPLRVFKSEGEEIVYAQGEGFLQVQPGGETVLLLVDEIQEPGDIDVSKAEERLRKAEDELSKAERFSAEERDARRDKRRYEAYLKVARGGDSH